MGGSGRCRPIHRQHWWRCREGLQTTMERQRTVSKQRQHGKRLSSLLLLILVGRNRQRCRQSRSSSTPLRCRSYVLGQPRQQSTGLQTSENRLLQHHVMVVPGETANEQMPSTWFWFENDSERLLLHVDHELVLSFKIKTLQTAVLAIGNAQHGEMVGDRQRMRYEEHVRGGFDSG